MELTAPQADALTELINIGYARAAAALSDLTGHRISLEVPEVAIHYIGEIAETLWGAAPLPSASATVRPARSGMPSARK